MPNLILLIVCFLLGVLLRRTGRLPEATPAALNAFIINVSLPALTLLYVHELPIDRSLAFPTAPSVRSWCSSRLPRAERARNGRD